MSVQCEVPGFEFDFDLFNQSAVRPVVGEKPDDVERSMKAVFRVKKKIVTFDKVIRRYYSTKDEVEELKKGLQLSQEECKQTCLDYKSVLDKYSLIEKEKETLNHRNAELEEYNITRENLLQAIQSHANQLQVLVKENETTIRNLTTENQAQKTNIRENEKSINVLQKEKDDLFKDIALMRSVILGKRKLNQHSKTILQKYANCYVSDDDDSVLGDSDTDIDNICLSPSATEVEVHPAESPLNINNKSPHITSKEDKGHDSDFSNELASGDTGRGSSIASDVEKCFNSPDYLLFHSPINDVHEIDKSIDTPASPSHSSQDILSSTNLTSKCDNIRIDLSPLNTCEAVSNEFKPRLFDEDNDDRIIITIGENSNAVNIIENTITEVSIDKAQNAVETYDENCNINVISPIPACIDISTATATQTNTETFGEKQCFELNNSSDFDETNAGDCEVEMILNEMRFDRTLITPIPSTPSKLRNTPSTYDRGSVLIHSDGHDVAKCNERFKIVEDKYDELMRLIISINDRMESQMPSKDNQSNLTSKTNNNIEGTIENIEETSLPNVHSPLMEENIPSTELSDDSSVYETEEFTVERKESLLPCDLNSSQTLDVKNSRKHIITFSESCDESIFSPQPLYNPTADSQAYSNFEENLKIVNQITTPGTPKDVSQKAKKQKLSKLERLRKKLVPRSKIKRNTTPAMKKLRLKSMLVPLNRKSTESEDVKAINNIKAYEKAVQIMSQLKSKQNSVIINKLGQMKTSKIKKSILKNLKSKKHSNIRNLFETKENSPSKISKTSTIHEEKSVNEKAIDIDGTIHDDGIIHNKKVGDEATQIISNNKCPQQSYKTKEDSPSKTTKINILVNESEVSNIEERQNDECSLTKPNKTRIPNKELIVAVVKCDEITNRMLLKSPSPKKRIATQGHNKQVEELVPIEKNVTGNENVSNNIIVEDNMATLCESICDDVVHSKRKRQKSESTGNPDVPRKRILRSNLRQSQSENNTMTVADPKNMADNSNAKLNSKNKNVPSVSNSSNNSLLNYSDLDIFEAGSTRKQMNKEIEPRSDYSKEIIFCVMLDHYGKSSRKQHSTKVPDSTLSSINKTLTDEISNIANLNPNEAKHAMNRLVHTIQSWDTKAFISTLMLYLKDPQRKIELFNKINAPPAPPMTKTEQILLYVISQLKVSCPSIDILNCVLLNIEYSLFKLNRTPEFNTIESMSHFYAVLCRYFKLKSRLRLFMLDAMYCIQFKAVPLIKQCIDVWMHVLPLAHMGIAKSPLVTCLVYLLHFYKCEDRFHRVQDIRNILSRKYFYEITEWNEPRIIEMFRSAIKEVRAAPVEMKLLRLALIVISKRYGPKWCQKNIVQNLLLPILEKEKVEKIRIFCISLLGPLLKPYPADMKVHCEIVFNILQDMLKDNESLLMQEAIMTSLIYMKKHNENRLLQMLLKWKPLKVSAQMESVLRNYVEEKPLKVWKGVLSKIRLTQ